MNSIPQHTPYKLFTNCIPVKGIARSTICDLQRNKVHLIPNSLYELLEETQGSTVAQIKFDVGAAYTDVINEYFEFLINEELIFFNEQNDFFPPLNMRWHTPSEIVYAIIDLGNDPDLNYESVIQNLDALDCKYIQIRAYYGSPITQCQKIIDAAELTTIVSIELILPFDTSVSREQWSDFCDKNNRITSVTIHSSPFAEEVLSGNFAVPICYSETKISSMKCCGKIQEKDFVSHIETYTESLSYNTCLNRKISIDIHGNIKNCPSMAVQFGNIKDTSLKEALSMPGFKKYWTITKDQVKVCKDCEFRHVCTDCRAYVEDPNDDYSKPLKCGYDPYTCEWQEWSTHPMKQKAIDEYEIFRSHNGVSRYN